MRSKNVDINDQSLGIVPQLNAPCRCRTLGVIRAHL